MVIQSQKSNGKNLENNYVNINFKKKEVNFIPIRDKEGTNPIYIFYNSLHIIFFKIWLFWVLYLLIFDYVTGQFIGGQIKVRIIIAFIFIGIFFKRYGNFKSTIICKNFKLAIFYLNAKFINK